MKICRFIYDEGEYLGFIDGDRVIPFTWIDNKLPDYLSYPFASDEDIRRILSIDDLSQYEGINIQDVRIVNPVKYPGKIICLGLNYESHVVETGLKMPEDIVIFMKPRTSLAGPFDEIRVPSFVRRLDYEGELALVIGFKGKYISKGDALNNVLGYMVFNDVTARDIQFKDRQWTRGKSLDGFAPIGPWIVTGDELGDPNDLRIRTWVNNELRQDSSTSEMIFKIPDIICRLSMVMTLEPGDIIATGTPSGVGVFRGDDYLLKDGDRVRIEIDGIGFIENTFKFIDI